jgi:hypothetical protein
VQPFRHQIFDPVAILSSLKFGFFHFLVFNCQSVNGTLKWKTFGSGTGSPITCGLGLSFAQIPFFCKVIGEAVYDSASEPTSVIGVYTGTQYRLITTNNDSSNSVPWLCGELNVQIAQSNTNGMTNTNEIVAANCSGGIRAAQICRSLGSSWYLPSINELAALAQNRNQLGLMGGSYWSSSSVPNFGGSAYYYHMSVFQIFEAAKVNSFPVRCVRNF